MGAGRYRRPYRTLLRAALRRRCGEGLRGYGHSGQAGRVAAPGDDQRRTSPGARLPSQLRLRAVCGAVEPGFYAVLPGPATQPHAPARAQRRYRHGIGAGRRRAPGQVQRLRDRPFLAHCPAGLRSNRQDLRRRPGNRLRHPGGRRARPGHLLSNRRRGGTGQCRAGLRAAADHPAGHPLRAATWSGGALLA